MPDIEIELAAGRYRVEQKLGSGPRTVVYAAHDTLLDAPRALKLIRAGERDELEVRQRFLTEARVLARVTHANVVRMFDYLHDEEHGPVLVMERARGVLRDVAPVWPLPPRRAAEVADQVLAGLGVLHGLGVVHRDLRIDNLLWGSSGHVLLSDLSSSRLSSETRLFHTQPGDELGLALNVAPEARFEPSKATAQSDLYSVGSLMFTLLTGQAPPDLSLSFMSDRVLEPLPEPFRPIVQRATAHEPAQRYASAGAMRQALQHLG